MDASGEAQRGDNRDKLEAHSGQDEVAELVHGNDDVVVSPSYHVVDNGFEPQSGSGSSSDDEALHEAEMTSPAYAGYLSSSLSSYSGDDEHDEQRSAIEETPRFGVGASGDGDDIPWSSASSPVSSSAASSSASAIATCDTPTAGGATTTDDDGSDALLNASQYRKPLPSIPTDASGPQCATPNSTASPGSLTPRTPAQLARAEIVRRRIANMRLRRSLRRSPTPSSGAAADGQSSLSTGELPAEGAGAPVGPAAATNIVSANDASPHRDNDNANVLDSASTLSSNEESDPIAPPHSPAIVSTSPMFLSSLASSAAVANAENAAEPQRRELRNAQPGRPAQAKKSATPAVQSSIPTTSAAGTPRQLRWMRDSPAPGSQSASPSGSTPWRFAALSRSVQAAMCAAQQLSPRRKANRSARSSSRSISSSDTGSANSTSTQGRPDSASTRGYDPGSTLDPDSKSAAPAAVPEKPNTNTTTRDNSSSPMAPRYTARAQSLNIETSMKPKVSSPTTEDALASGESSTDDPALPSNSIITDIGLYGVDFTRYNPTAANLDKECRITVALQSALLSTRSAFTKGMTAHIELGIDGKWHDSNLGAFALHKSPNQGAAAGWICYAPIRPATWISTGSLSDYRVRFQLYRPSMWSKKPQLCFSTRESSLLEVLYKAEHAIGPGAELPEHGTRIDLAVTPDGQIEPRTLHLPIFRVNDAQRRFNTGIGLLGAGLSPSAGSGMKRTPSLAGMLSHQVGSIDLLITIEPSVLRREAFARQLLASSPFDDLEPDDPDESSGSDVQGHDGDGCVETPTSPAVSGDHGTPQGHSKLRRTSRPRLRSSLAAMTAQLAARNQKRAENMSEMAHTMRVFSFPSGHALRIMQANPLIPVPPPSFFSFVLGGSGGSGDHFYAHCCLFYHEITAERDPVAHYAITSRLPDELHDGRLLQPVCLWAITNAALHMIMRRIFCRVLGLSLTGHPSQSVGMVSEGLHASASTRTAPPPPPRGDASNQTGSNLSPPSTSIVDDDEEEGDEIKTPTGGALTPLKSPVVRDADIQPDSPLWQVSQLMQRPVRSLRAVASAMTREINTLLVDFQRHYLLRCIQLEQRFADNQSALAPSSSRSLYMELPAVDLCYDALFERLRPDTIVMLFNVLICQRNVVVTAATIDGLTDVMEVALSLLWPLQWDGAYIPLVPPAHEHLLGFIENTPPVPFFMGISLDGGLVLPEPNRQDDCVRLNLETNAVTPEVLPAEWAMLPPQLFVYLLDATTECADALSEAGSAPDASSPSRSHNDTHAGGNGFKRALAIHKFRIAYAAVVISLLAGYDKFIYRGGVRMASPAARARAAAAKPNESSAESSSATELGRNSESMSFDTEAFLQYKRDIYAADDGAVQFMTAVTDTQMFGSFITSDDGEGHTDVAKIVSSTSYHNEIYSLLAGPQAGERDRSNSGHSADGNLGLVPPPDNSGETNPAASSLEATNSAPVGESSEEKDFPQAQPSFPAATIANNETLAAAGPATAYEPDLSAGDDSDIVLKQSPVPRIPFGQLLQPAPMHKTRSHSPSMAGVALRPTLLERRKLRVRSLSDLVSTRPNPGNRGRALTVGTGLLLRLQSADPHDPSSLRDYLQQLEQQGQDEQMQDYLSPIPIRRTEAGETTATSLAQHLAAGGRDSGIPTRGGGGSDPSTPTSTSGPRKHFFATEPPPQRSRGRATSWTGSPTSSPPRERRRRSVDDMSVME